MMCGADATQAKVSSQSSTTATHHQRLTTQSLFATSALSKSKACTPIQRLLECRASSKQRSNRPALQQTTKEAVQWVSAKLSVAAACPKCRKTRSRRISTRIVRQAL
eukprot:392854-Amphidinium_carterae.1